VRSKRNRGPELFHTKVTKETKNRLFNLNTAIDSREKAQNSQKKEEEVRPQAGMMRFPANAVGRFMRILRFFAAHPPF
jgi:hypothetical protein